MDADTVKRMFEPFFTTKTTGQGTGLGLATVYGVVNQSGGHIAVSSEPGAGTTFNICLPQTDEQPSSDASVVSRTAPRGSESVLVVEDEQLVREFAQKVLQRLGYRVHAVESGAEAIHYATLPDTRIDLILSDVVLPELSGPAMAAELARRGIAPIVIYMSGYTDDTITQDEGILASGSFLPKPFSSDSLAHTIRHALDIVSAA
jgi:CheY-like chemotaxis protein